MKLGRVKYYSTNRVYMGRDYVTHNPAYDIGAKIQEELSEKRWREMNNIEPDFPLWVLEEQAKLQE